MQNGVDWFQMDLGIGGYQVKIEAIWRIEMECEMILWNADIKFLIIGIEVKGL